MTAFNSKAIRNEKRARVETDRGGHRISVGTGGSATGEGGDRLVIDDPHNVAEVESAIVRKGTLDWFDQVWEYTRANDPKATARVVIMQRSHCDDLAGHVLEQGRMGTPAASRLRTEGDTRKTSIGWSDPRHTEGELLWPERFGAPEIAEARRTLWGSFAYAGQYQQRLGAGQRRRRLEESFVLKPYRCAGSAAVISTCCGSWAWDCTFKDSENIRILSPGNCGDDWARISTCSIKFMAVSTFRQRFKQFVT